MCNLSGQVNFNLFHISPVEMIGAGGLIIMGRKNTIQVFFPGRKNI
jgi:hypothetical protein